jgi:hypothetical protein
VTQENSWAEPCGIVIEGLELSEQSATSLVSGDPAIATRFHLVRGLARVQWPAASLEGFGSAIW